MPSSRIAQLDFPGDPTRVHSRRVIPIQQRPAGDPPPLPYLYDAQDQERGAYDITLEAHLIPVGAANAPYKLSEASGLSLYWTIAQLIAHHASGGCNLQSRDLLEVRHDFRRDPIELREPCLSLRGAGTL